MLFVWISKNVWFNITSIYTPWVCSIGSSLHWMSHTGTFCSPKFFSCTCKRSLRELLWCKKRKFTMHSARLSPVYTLCQWSDANNWRKQNFCPICWWLLVIFGQPIKWKWKNLSRAQSPLRNFFNSLEVILISTKSFCICVCKPNDERRFSLETIQLETQV